MNLYLISNGSYTMSTNVELIDEQRLHRVIIVEATDAFDNCVKEAVDKFINLTGTDKNQVTINKLSHPMSFD